MVAVELEVLAKKYDRFGWDRDRGSAAHDRLVMDWMDALQDFPINEVRSACRAVVKASPNRMPNEGHVVGAIQAARAKIVQSLPKPVPVEEPRAQVSAERASEIMAEVGFAPKRFGGPK